MSLNVNMDAAQLASLYQTALQGAGVNNVQVTASEDGKSLTISSLNSDGSVRNTQTISNVPEIDLPSGSTVGDSATLASFVNSLGEVVKTLSGLDEKGLDAVGKNFNEAVQRLVGELKTSSSDSGGTGKVSAMYCIYRLMALMLEVAREQREVARAQREADTQMVVKEMESQRQSMIDNAITGMITCCVVAVVQLGMIYGSSSRSDNLDRMKQDNRLCSGRDTFANVNEMAAHASNDQAMQLSKTNAGANLDASVNKYVASNALPGTDRADALNAKTALDAKFDNINSDTTLSPGAKTEARQKVYEEMKAERDMAKSEFLKTAGTDSPDPQARQKLEIANAKLEYAAARLLTDETPEGRTAFSEKAKSDMHAAAALGGGLEAQIDKLASSNDTRDKVYSVLSNTIKELSNQAVTLRDAQTKKYDQAIELSREQRESSKDLVSVALEMFRNMLNVLKAILDAENASFREIMG